MCMCFISNTGCLLYMSDDSAPLEKHPDLIFDTFIQDVLCYQLYIPTDTLHDILFFTSVLFDSFLAILHFIVVPAKGALILAFVLAETGVTTH